MQVYVKPAPSRRLDEGQKVVVQLQLSGRAAPSEHSPRKRSGRKRKAAHSPHKMKGRAVYNSADDNDDNDNDNNEEEDGDFGDCSGEDGEGDGAAGPSESAGGSPTKRRRSNHGSSWVSATPRNAAAAGRGAGAGGSAAVAVSDSDEEWTGNLCGASVPGTHRPITRSGRRRAVAQRRGQGASGRGPLGAPALLDDEVIEISSN